MCVVLGAGLVAIAVWMLSFGRHIERGRRFPPADARPIQDPVVRRGEEAVRLAWVLYGGAGVLFVAGIAIPFQIWRLLESLAIS